MMTELLTRLFIKNKGNTRDSHVRESYGRLGGIVGICCNALLCIIKVTVGLLTSSISIVADGLNNLSDMGSSVVTIIGFKLACKPADKGHPFGHGRMEYMSAFIVAGLILLVGFELFISSVKALFGPGEIPDYSFWSVAVLAVSVLIKFWMFVFNRKLGREIGSAALTTTAQDSINDAVASLAVLVSIGISVYFNPPFNLDAAMAAGVSLFILWSGFSTAKGTIDEILGCPTDKEVIKEIESIILSFDAFIGFHDLIVHNYGPGRQFASVHVEVPQDVDIVNCHEQIDICEKTVCEKLNISLVIHMDPIDVNNEDTSAAKAVMQEVLSAIDERLTLHDFRMTPVGNSRTNLIFDVVIPADITISPAQLENKINKMARLINPTYCCVITFDRDFS